MGRAEATSIVVGIPATETRDAVTSQFKRKTRQILTAVPVVRGCVLWWRLLVKPIAVLKETERVDNYLKEKGWPKSYYSGLARDRLGRPIPWFTYPATDFLAPRLRSGLHVFEYGCGYSTLWWVANGCRVTACETSREWANRIESEAGSSAKIVVRDPNTDGYVREVVSGDTSYDIVLVDGERRVECLLLAPHALNRGGVIVLDNSDRTQYEAGVSYLTSLGFRRLDFVGLGPVNASGWTTSVFYRPENCLGI